MYGEKRKGKGNEIKRDKRERWRRGGEVEAQSATLRETKLPLSAFFGEIGI